MTRKLLIVAATVVAIALAAGVERASADGGTLAFYTASPDLVVSDVTPSYIAIENVPQPTWWGGSWPTKTAGPFRVYVRLIEVKTGFWGWRCKNWATRYFDVPSLQAGSKFYWAYPYPYENWGATQGWVFVDVDSANQVAERDETNNRYTFDCAEWFS